MRRWLRHQAEDMGTAFREPSELRFIIRTIGVPNRGLRERFGGALWVEGMWMLGRMLWLKLF
jgi:hypothetical protein